MRASIGTKIISVEFEEDTILIRSEIKIYKEEPSKLSDKLFKASSEQRQLFAISPGGYGIHWPLLDEDISLAGIISHID